VITITNNKTDKHFIIYGPFELTVITKSAILHTNIKALKADVLSAVFSGVMVTEISFTFSKL